MYGSDGLKVVIVGAGSTSFGPATIYDLYQNVFGEGGTLGLVDTDPLALSRMHGVAERLAEYMSVPVTVESNGDRTSALAGADVVVISVELDRAARWELDWEIPRQFGIQHTLGENRGPGGLSHALRTVPLVMEICRDIERISPSALVIIMTNPEDRVASAVNKYTSLRALGYCDGLWDFKHNYVSKLLDVPGDKVFLEGAGINHAVWVTALRDTRTGADLYPALVSEARRQAWQPFGLHLYERFGLWPHENDEHYGEYFPYACDFIDCKGYDFAAYRRDNAWWKDRATELVDGRYPVESFAKDVADKAWAIFGDVPPTLTIRGVVLGESRYLQNANIVNINAIPGAPPSMIVEVPGVATPTGVHAVGQHVLPAPILVFLRREGEIQQLVAEAAYEGSRSKALLALELDAHVGKPSLAEDLLEAFLEAHREYIPEDQWKGLKGLA